MRGRQRKMSSNSIYRKKFEELLRTEEKARDLYQYYIERLEDPVLLEKFKEIYSDELRHVAITKNFLELLS